MNTETVSIAYLDGVRLNRALRAGIARVIADLLHVTPVLTNLPDGRIAPGGKLWGRSNLVAKFARFILRNVDVDKTYRLAVGHCDDLQSGRVLLELIQAGTPQLESSQFTEVGPALGVHAGPGGLVVGLQEYLPPRSESD